MKVRAMDSVEAERRFYLMNNVCTDERLFASFKHMSDLMTINIIGRPDDSCVSQPYVQTWIPKRHSADDRELCRKLKIFIRKFRN
jgi:hypothetical protein